MLYFDLFIVPFQSYAREVFAQQQFIKTQSEAKAIVIQKYIRSYLARKHYEMVRHGIIKLQAHVRRRAAKKELKKLKVILILNKDVFFSYKSYVLAVSH